MSDNISLGDREAFFKIYDAHTKILRAWLVAYGVGGPVLILTHEKIAKKVTDSGFGREIALLFIIGVGLQVLLSLVNKWVNWGLYAYSETEQHVKGKRYKACSWTSEQVWFDILLDIGTIGAFGMATWKLMSLFT